MMLNLLLFQWITLLTLHEGLRQVSDSSEGEHVAAYHIVLSVSFLKATSGILIAIQENVPELDFSMSKHLLNHFMLHSTIMNFSSF